MKNTKKYGILAPLSAGFCATVLTIAGGLSANVSYASTTVATNTERTSSVKSSEVSGSSDYVQFEDSALKNAVLNYLKNSFNSSSWGDSPDGALLGENDTEITVEQANKVTNLDLSSSSISSIKGIKAFKNLKAVNLSSNSITDISPIKDLSKLTDINFSFNYELKDISVVKGLSNLQKINFYYDKVADITPIKDLKNLTEINFSNNDPINGDKWQDNINVLKTANWNLTDLKLSGIKIGDNLKLVSKFKNLKHFEAVSSGIKTVEPLKDLTSLTNLNLESNNIENIGDLSKLTKLTSLNLNYNNNISNISVLSNFKDLNDFRIARNNITDISSIADLHKLTVLWLNDNKISNTAPLRNLSDLSLLYIGGNKLNNDNLKDFINMSSIVCLWFENNNITDISTLKDLKNVANINSLKIDDNKISDISPLKSLTSLEDLYANGGNISDISPLKDLEKLRIVEISHNNISDITPLGDLKNLSSVDLSYNKISDISPLKDATGLWTLNVHDNKITDYTPLNKLSGVSLDYGQSNQKITVTLPSGVTTVTVPEVKLPTRSGAEYVVTYAGGSGSAVDKDSRKVTFNNILKANESAEITFTIKNANNPSDSSFGGKFIVKASSTKLSMVDKHNNDDPSNDKIVEALNLGEVDNEDKPTVTKISAVSGDEYKMRVTLTYKSGFVADVVVPLRLIKTTEVQFKTKYEADPNATYESKTTTTAGVKGSTTTTSYKDDDGNVVSSETNTPATNAVIKVGNKKVEIEEIQPGTTYEADSSLKYNQEQTTEGTKGSKTTTTIYIVNADTGLTDEVDGTPKVETKAAKDKVIKIGNLEKKTSDIAFKKTYEGNPDLTYQKQETKTAGKKGQEEVTLTYKVDAKTGLTTEVEAKKGLRTQPVNEVIQVGNKEVIQNEDGSTTTKTYKVNPNDGTLSDPTVVTSRPWTDIASGASVSEVLKAKMTYTTDDSLPYGQTKKVSDPKDGEKITTPTGKVENGKWVEGEPKVEIKAAVNGVTKVGNKKVETEDIQPGTVYEADSTLDYNKQQTTEGTKGTKTTTTIYKVNADTGLTDEVDGTPNVVTVQAKNKVIKVGNKQVTHEGDKTITTTYDVDPNTGKLTNPKKHTSMPAGNLTPAKQLQNPDSHNPSGQGGQGGGSQSDQGGHGNDSQGGQGDGTGNTGDGNSVEPDWTYNPGLNIGGENNPGDNPNNNSGNDNNTNGSGDGTGNGNTKNDGNGNGGTGSNSAVNNGNNTNGSNTNRNRNGGSAGGNGSNSSNSAKSNADDSAKDSAKDSSKNHSDSDDSAKDSKDSAKDSKDSAKSSASNSAKHVSNSSNFGLIASIIGALVAVAAVVGGFFFLLFAKKRKKRKDEDENENGISRG